MKKETKKLTLEGLQVISFTTAIRGGNEPIDEKDDKGDKIATDTKWGATRCGGMSCNGVSCLPFLC